MTTTTANQNSNSANNTETAYWNDHYTGACFLNNLREVQTRQNPFFSVDVHVKQGEKAAGGKTKTQRINANVVGNRAKAIIEALLEKYDFTKGVKSDDNPEGHPPISAIFTIGDLWADAYISNQDNKPRGALKGRLISLKHVYVENERFDDPEVFGEGSEETASVESEDSLAQAPQSEASDNQADDATAMEQDAEQDGDDEQLDEMSIFVGSAAGSDSMSLDSNDPLYKKKLQFLLANGFVWCGKASSYVPKDLAA